MEPALAPVAFGARVPGDAKRLQVPLRHLDQVLLQGKDAEGVADLEVGELPVGGIGADPELVTLFCKGLRSRLHG